MMSFRLLGRLAAFNTLALASALAQVAPAPAASVPAEEKTIVLDPFEISTQRDIGYSSTQTLGASRLNVDLRDTPLAIVTLNEAFLADIAPLNTSEALMYVSNFAPNETGLNEQFNIRGNGLDGSMRDGLPEPSGPASSVNNSVIDPAFYQRLEVIKGPSGTIYGTQSLGGIVNRVSKQPRFDRSGGSAKLTVGDFSMLRGVLDYNHVNAAGNLAVRFVGLVQEAETIPGDADDRRQFAPMIGYRTKNAGRLWLITHYGENETMTGSAPWFIDSAGNISTTFKRRFSYNQNDAKNEDSRLFIEAGFQQNVPLLGETWTARLVGRHNRVKFEDRLYNPRQVQFFGANGAVIPNGNLRSNYTDVRITNWTVRDQVEDLDNLGAFFDFTGEVSTGPIRHQILTYLQYQTTDKYIRRVTNNWKEMSYFFPVYEANPAQFRRSPTDAVALDNNGLQDTFAWGFQESAALFRNRLNIVAGARYDWVSDSLRDRRNNVFFSDRTNKNWLYSYGLTFDVTRDLTLFALHSETYVPQGGTDDLGNSVPNQQGENDEVGVKLVLMNGKLTATASYFDMAIDNILELTFIPSMNVALRVPAGDRTTKGWEADVRYSHSRNLNFTFAMGELETRSTSGNIGRNVPQGFNYSAFAKYDFVQGPLNGLGLGTGYAYISERSVEGAPNFMFPGNHEWNGVVTYRLNDQWNFHLAINNIDDTRAARSSALNARIMPVAPRHVRFTATYSF